MASPPLPRLLSTSTFASLPDLPAGGLRVASGWPVVPSANAGRYGKQPYSRLPFTGPAMSVRLAIQRSLGGFLSRKDYANSSDDSDQYSDSDSGGTGDSEGGGSGAASGAFETHFTLSAPVFLWNQPLPCLDARPCNGCVM